MEKRKDKRIDLLFKLYFGLSEASFKTEVEKKCLVLELVKNKAVDLMIQITTNKEEYKSKVVISTSKIQGGGNGLFVNKNCKISTGEIVAFYPGTLYFEEDLPLAENFGVFEENDYIHSRMDSCLIDGRLSDISKTIFQMCFQRNFPKENKDFNKIEKNRFDSFFENPLALGNFINHPLPPQIPNVVTFDVDFERESPFLNKIPVCYWKLSSQLSTDEKKKVKGIVVIAIKDLNGDEELLLDYNYKNKDKFPTWYVEALPIEEN